MRQDDHCGACLYWSDSSPSRAPLDGMCFLDEYNPEPCSAYHRCIHFKAKED